MSRTYQDEDGRHPVIEWRVFYPDAVYCSCHHDVDDLPLSGVQAVGWFIMKNGTVRCQVDSGLITHPSIYTVDGRALIGTMLPDDIYYPLEKNIFESCVERVAELRRIHG